MKIEFIECRWQGKALLSEAQIKLLPKKVGLCATVQYLGLLKDIRKQIEKSKRQVILLDSNNTNTLGQILGCSSFRLQGFEDILFIGDGMFHPINLKVRFGQRVLAFNPLSKKMHEVTEAEVGRLRGRINAMRAKFYSSKCIGVLLSTKPGQLWNGFDSLEQKYPEKRFYYFAFDEVNLGQLENFRFVDVFVNTACPRLGMEDSLEQGKPIINLEFVE